MNLIRKAIFLVLVLAAVFPAGVAVTLAVPAATPSAPVPLKVSTPDLLRRIKQGSPPEALRAAKLLPARLKGTITAASGNTFLVDGKTVNIQANTVLLRRFGAKSALSEFSIGDEVMVVGKWADEAKTTLDGRLIRNLSVQKRHGTFVGTIQSLTGSGFVMQTVQRGSQTVTVGSATKYVNRKELAIAFADLKVGHKVRVKGLWNNKANTITEVVHLKDYSLPVPPAVIKVATPSANSLP